MHERVFWIEMTDPAVEAGGEDISSLEMGQGAGLQ